MSDEQNFTLDLGLAITAGADIQPGPLRLAVASYFEIPHQDVTPAHVAQYEQEIGTP